MLDEYVKVLYDIFTLGNVLKPFLGQKSFFVINSSSLLSSCGDKMLYIIFLLLLLYFSYFLRVIELLNRIFGLFFRKRGERWNGKFFLGKRRKKGLVYV